MMMIFDNLKIDLDAPERLRRRDYLDSFNCRLVHPNWKQVMDTVLEKRCMEVWTKWDPFCSHPQKHLKLPCLAGMMVKNEFQVDTSGCLPSVLEPAEADPDGSNPFPFKSLYLDYCKDGLYYTKGIDYSKMMNVTDFLSNCGHSHHLTNLTLWFDDLPAARITFNVKHLQGILQLTPNLKALTLHGLAFIAMKTKRFPCELPPLPHLRHMRVLNTTFNVNSTHNWLLEPYKQKLETVESIGHFSETYGHLDFPSLVRLHVGREESHDLRREMLLFQAPVNIPLLSSLSLGNFRMGFGRAQEREDAGRVIKFLNNFSPSLVELHIFIERFTRILAQLSTEEIIGTSNIFGLVTTLSIPLPSCPEQTGRVKDWLKRFPGLETLCFITFRFKALDYSRVDDERKRANARNELVQHLQMEEYANCCPKLKTIIGRLSGKSRPFYTRRVR